MTDQAGKVTLGKVCFCGHSECLSERPRVVAETHGLDPIALDIQAMLNKRLIKGRIEHGPWESDEEMTKDMIEETLEEISDALIYVGRKLVQIRRQKGS